jgi:hypothetical protein
MKEERLKRNTDESEFVHVKSNDMLRITKKERFLLCLFFSDRIMFVYKSNSSIGLFILPKPLVVIWMDISVVLVQMDEKRCRRVTTEFRWKITLSRVI